MATRSLIGIVEDDGSVRAIYCHWDGYPAGNGALLRDHYKDPDKIRKLISLGSISSLCEEVAPPQGVKHSYDHPLPNVTVAYMRDRGESEEGNLPYKFDSVDAYVHSPEMQDWGYLFENGTWSVIANEGGGRKKMTLTQVLQGDEKAAE